LLRRDLRGAATISDPAERALEIVAIVAEVASRYGVRPVIVGGMAVYFWTVDDSFLTSDIDVVMETPAEVLAGLEHLGLQRLDDGRHWHLPGTDVLLEAPAARLDRDADVAEVELESGRTVLVESRVDILLDRLDEFQATGHRIVAQQVLVLLAQGDVQDAALRRKARNRRLGKVLRSMAELATAIAAGDELPDTDELHALARQAMRAEYSG
jgi:hypothetical protein